MDPSEIAIRLLVTAAEYFVMAGLACLLSMALALGVVVVLDRGEEALGL